MANKKYFIEYYYNGTLTKVRIRTWADSHRQLFPEYGFTNSQSDFPITHLIARKLKLYGFVEIITENEVVLKSTQKDFKF
jgi:hypothetical protein